MERVPQLFGLVFFVLPGYVGLYAHEQAAVDKKETKTQPVLQRKEHRGAYPGPSGPPVEMTGDTFVNPTPTVTPAAPGAPPPRRPKGTDRPRTRDDRHADRRRRRRPRYIEGVDVTLMTSETGPAVLLDSNAYRGMKDSRFDALVDLERARGVTRYAEPFALMELLAHLLDPPDSKTFRACRASLGRMFRRCAGGGPCGIIRDSESRIAEAVTGRGLARHDNHTDQLRLLLMHVGEGHPLALIEPQLRSITDHIAAMEAQWADVMRRLQQNADAPPTQKDDPMRQRITESSREASAGLFLRIAGQEPSAQAIARVRRGAAAWVEFGARVIDRVVFDRANVDAPEVRNYLWDQRLAFNIGQTIGPRTLWVVTEDGAFAEAAAATGFGDRVYKPDAYERWLAQPTKE